MASPPLSPPPAETPTPPPAPQQAIAHSPLLPESPTPSPTPPPPHSANDDSPPLPPETPAPPPPRPTTRHPALAPEKEVPPPPPPSAPPPPPPPAPASPDGKAEPEAVEKTGESENLTLALALTQTEGASPPPTLPKTAAADAPTGSLPKESSLTIGKLLSGEDSAATDAKPSADKAAAGGGGVGSKRWLIGGAPEKVRRAELRRAELGFRVSAVVLCLVSLSVMAADTTPGWAGDSFRRYNEYRYTLAASVMGLAYSGFQVVAEVHYLVSGKHIIRRPWGNYFNLAVDQMLAYLLLSASSAALSRNNVWVSRFGVDEFAKLINASASMAFLAFVAIGFSSIISAYYAFSSMY